MQLKRVRKNCNFHNCSLATVDNHTKHGNHGNRDFCQMPWFCQKCHVFCQNVVVLHFHKNISFLISIIWSLSCEFNKKYSPFLCLCYQSLCALFILTSRICDRDVILVYILSRICSFLELETMSFSKLSAI